MLSTRVCPTSLTASMLAIQQSSLRLNLQVLPLSVPGTGVPATRGLCNATSSKVLTSKIVFRSSNCAFGRPHHRLIPGKQLAFSGGVCCHAGKASSPSPSTNVKDIPVDGGATPQRTLARPLMLSGVGLHMGLLAQLTVMPAPAGTGRYFAVIDAGGGEVVVPATLASVSETQLSTTLASGAARVQTVEHLLSALEGMGVTNARLELRGGGEVPLLDGSADLWVRAIKDAGVVPATSASAGSGEPLACGAPAVLRPVTVHEGDAFVAAFPAKDMRLTYGIDFSQLPVVGRQWFTWTPADAGGYEGLVAPARTFGIMEQIEQLRAMGLIKGGSLDNALVCSMKTGWVNPPLRFPDEPCRHKLLDLIGDLALLGVGGHAGLPRGHIVAYKASHALHVRFARALLQDLEAEGAKSA